MRQCRIDRAAGIIPPPAQQIAQAEVAADAVDEALAGMPDPAVAAQAMGVNYEIRKLANGEGAGRYGPMAANRAAKLGEGFLFCKQ